MSKKKPERQELEPLIQPKIRPLTKNQNLYWKAIDNNVVTIAVGPSGSSKTYSAAYKAVKMLEAGEIKQIVITRPICGAGESLGAMPGDVLEKIHPYLLPVLECFYEFLGTTKTKALIEEGVIQLIPLALMRGLTRKNCLMILDEAQNATLGQIRLFLTRLGENSKMVINGDIKQRDIRDSGLQEVWQKLKKVEGIECIELSREDIVRHPLISIILDKIGE